MERITGLMGMMNRREKIINVHELVVRQSTSMMPAGLFGKRINDLEDLR